MNTAGGEQPGLIKRTGRFGDDKDPNMGAEFRWKPGQSGNPKGSKPGKSLSATIQEMWDDPNFIERLANLAPEGAGPDPQFQSTAMKAAISVAMLHAMDPNQHPTTRKDARDWLAKFGYGSKVDITSKGERISEAPKIISIIRPRGGDDSAAPTEA